MTQEETLFRAVLDAPDDDAPRLAFASWLARSGQVDRAEFIRVQISLARLPEEDPRRGELKERERELLERHGEEWRRPFGGAVCDDYFRRGFIESIAVRADEFLRDADDIFRRAPIRHVSFGSLWDNAGRQFAWLEASPQVARLQSVSLRFGCYFVGDRDFEILAASPRLLRRLGRLSVVECHVSEAGLGPVVLSPDLLRLTGLHLSDCQLGSEAGVRPLAESANLRRLASLSLHRNALGDEGVRLLAASPNAGRLEHLDLEACGVGDAGATALARSPHLGRLRSLHVSENAVSDAGALALAGSPLLAGLEYLHLQGNRIGDPGALALADSPHLGRLRALLLWQNDISEDGREALRRRFGDHIHF